MPKTVLGRAALVMNSFGADQPELALNELVRRTGLPKSTVHRVAEALVAQGWLERLDNSYAVGVRVFELASLVNYRQELREVAVPFMQDLYEATHEIVHLGVLKGSEVLYVDKIGSHRRMNVPSRVGGTMPAYCTGLGKAILGFSGPDVVQQVVRTGLQPRTMYTIVSPELLLEELKRVHSQGYAIDREEAGTGIVCAAVPIFAHRHVVAAISVTGPSYRLDPERLAPAVRTAALGTSRALMSPTRARA